MKLNGSEFGRALGISRAAVSKALSEKKIVKDGKLIDTESKINILYINSSPKKKIAFDEYCKNGGKTSVTEIKKTVKSKPKQIKESVESEKKEVLITENSEVVSDFDPESLSEMKMIADTRNAQEKVVKIVLENQKVRNELANRKILEDIIDLLFNHFITGIPRTSSTSLTDVGKMILADGEVKNAHFKVNEDSWMEFLNEGKIKVSKYLNTLKK